MKHPYSFWCDCQSCYWERQEKLVEARARWKHILQDRYPHLYNKSVPTQSAKRVKKTACKNAANIQARIANGVG